ncbi:uncharacterized protein EAE98_006072 [Botrytis deweyae]|uniref:Uncharacterized protein n=2 Tax=Botrytis TaxID=33196 RepID=A0A4Z1JSI2_9HELO|nr:uncharacterized protein EAE98_006072 [Botrytis deweyae]KAF7916884.1 hypothetical protein EAE99_009509 [Botrytis elliptica]KAF7927690.1 hypothetical protein EAE98_006072 [Botrytis deweyae]TGO76214.1 hypothetical protein BELL_0168g00150 [Botrytis elliptica]
MPPKSQTPLTDKEKCYTAVFSQIVSEGKVPKLNYDKLAEDLGLPTPDAARIRWGRMVTMIKNGTVGELKIASTGKAQKRNKEEAGIEDEIEGMDDVASPTKKQKHLAPRKKAGGAGRKAEKEMKEERFMNGGEGSGFDVPDDSDLV